MTAPGLDDGAQQALLDLLSPQHRWRRSPAVLTVGAVLEELAVTLEEVAHGRSAPLSADRRSLVGDVDLALTRCGLRLQQVTSPDLKQLRVEEVSRLEGVLADQMASRALAEVVRDVLEQLRSDDAVTAAWADVIERFSDGASTTGELMLSIDQLNELLRSRGHELWAAHSSLRQHIRNGEWEEARDAVTGLAGEEAVVAWVVLANASLGKPVRRVGQVRFFDGGPGLHAVRKWCDQEGHELLEPLPELTDEALDMHFTSLPGEHLVFARVELAGPRAKRPEGGYRVPQLEWARTFVADLIEAAGFRFGGTEWTLLDGGCTFLADGGDGDSITFGDPVDRERNSRLGDPRFDPTADQLASLPEGFADALAAGRQTARDASEAVNWHRNVEKTSDPRQRLALHVRRFEVQWTTGDRDGWQSWEGPLRHYLRDSWARHYQEDFLMFAGYRLHRDAPLAHPKARVAETAVGVYEREGAHGFTIDLRAVISVAPVVAGGFRGGSLHRRLFKEVARHTASSPAGQEWWRLLRGDFDVLLNRAVRQRNRVIHGRETVLPVIESAGGFVSRLAASLAREAVRAAAGSTSVDGTLENNRAELIDLFERLPSEPSLADAWFKPANGS
jgi:hypothetical protein